MSIEELQRPNKFRFYWLCTLNKEKKMLCVAHSHFLVISMVKIDFICTLAMPQIKKNTQKLQNMKLLLKFAHFPSVMSNRVECFCDELNLKSVFSLTNFILRLCQLSCSQSEFQCQHNKLKHTAINYDTWSLLTETKLQNNVRFTEMWIILLGGKVFILLFFFYLFLFCEKKKM